MKKTLKDYYLDYPYKTTVIDGKTVQLPYVPKDQITNHYYTVSYKEWLLVLDLYFKYFIESLLEGNEIKVTGFGKFSFKKYKKTNGHGVDWKEFNQTGVYKKYTNFLFDNNRVILKWLKPVNAIFQNCGYYKIGFQRNIWKIIYSRLFNDPSLIHNYKNTKDK